MARWPTLCILALGLVVAVAGRLFDDGDASPFWGLEFGLYAMLIWRLWRPAGARPPGPAAVSGAAFVLLSWTFGMAYELSLTLTGEGLGGLHPQTGPSFVLAQGDYVPLALATLLAIRRLHLDFTGAVWLALGLGLTHGLVFTGVFATTLATQPFLALPLLAYDTLVFASSIALPLLLIAPGALWNARPPIFRATPFRLVLLGCATEAGVWLFRGLIWTPLASWAFALPPNPL